MAGSNGGNVTVGGGTETVALDLTAAERYDTFMRFARKVAAQCQRLGVNPNELDKRGDELAERVAAYVKSL